MTTTAYLSVLWTDSELQWTPADYGGLTATFLPQDNIWKPDIALKNSNTDYKTLGMSKLNVEVSSDGTVEWYPFEIFQSTCSVDISYFPFDVQTCKLTFVTWSYGQDEVLLKHGGGVDLTVYEASPSWDLLDTFVSEETIGEELSLSFTIKVKRKSLYAMLSIVLPILLLAVLNLFVFIVPEDKSSFSVTVFLAFAIFLTIVEATMPNNSTSVPVFSIYVILLTTQSTLITVIAVLVERGLSFEVHGTKIPKWIITLSNIGTFKTCRKNERETKVHAISSEKHVEVRKTDINERPVEKEEQYTWRMVMNRIDTLCFIGFSLFTIIVTVICMVVSAADAASQ